MNKKDLERINKIKESIDSAKTEKAEINGRLKELMKNLEERFGVKTIEEAKKKKNEKWAELEVLEKKIDTNYKELVANFEWD